MSLAELRTLLLGASLGEGAVPAFARLALETWGSDASATARPAPMTNAEKCARSRMRAKGIEPPPRPRWGPSRDTENDTDATPNDTVSTPSDTEHGVTDSLSFSSSLSGSSSSSLSPSSKLLSSENPQGSKGSTARAQAAAAASTERQSGDVDGGTFALTAPSATPSATPSDTENDTVATPLATPSRSGPRKRTPKADVGHRLPRDWTPPRDLVTWTEAQGVDAAAVFAEFRDHWLARTDRRAYKADWEATFRNRVRDLLKGGSAPRLRRRPAPPPDDSPAPATPPELASLRDAFFRDRDGAAAGPVIPVPGEPHAQR